MRLKNETTQRTGRLDGNVTKEKILNAAIKLFREHGYDAVTAKDISKFAGTNTAAINYHFINFNGLLNDVEKIIHIPSYEELLAIVRDRQAQ